MLFSFSSKFRQSLYRQLLRALAAEIDTYRQICGINITDMMKGLHISHPILKRY